VLCHFANEFPEFVANFLQHGRKLRRRFREESVTDLLMGSLLSIGGRFVIVEFPNEPVTGADMEWNFVNHTDRTFFRLLLQAKQLYGDGALWTWHCYKELLHETGTPSQLQAQTLCDTARTQPATYPLYILYHPQGSCELADKAGAVALQGVNLADGFDIEALARSAKGRTLRTKHKSLGTIYPLLFSLTDLFCPSRVVPSSAMALAPQEMPMVLAFEGGKLVLGTPIPPLPEDVRQRLVERRAQLAGGERDVPPDSVPTVPQVATTIPPDVQRTLDRHFDRTVDRKDAEDHLSRWRVTFVSFNPAPPVT
jgi:Family of unknown function (DUF6615)